MLFPSVQGRLLFIAGQVAIDENNQLIGSGDFNAQMDQVFNNLGHILESADKLKNKY